MKKPRTMAGRCQTVVRRGGSPHPEVAVIVRGHGYQGVPGKEFRHCTCGLCEAEFTRGMVKDAAAPRKGDGV
ncbi:hypothetical protein D0Z66_12580 [Cereibacter sphaeroides]|nr:hypothetical protein D0Z66_12580 [Cereibacter sphaeroides]